MTTIGFNFTSSDIYYVAVSGTLNAPTFIVKNKISLPANFDVPTTVDWFENELTAIINNINPDQVSYMRAACGTFLLAACGTACAYACGMLAGRSLI